MASHIALLGDSVFDNRTYTAGGPDVVAHLRDLLPPLWRATLCAVDGSTATDLAAQFSIVPSDTSHVVISVGGNDALLNSDLLGTPVSSTADALALFGDRADRFEEAYRAAIAGALRLNRDTTVCTIYNGNFDVKEAPLARVALMVFNDVILRVAIEHRLRAIDLRLVCTEAADYANPIEPSRRGGRKIAQAILRSVGAADGHIQFASVYAG